MYEVVGGATSQSIYVDIWDSSSTIGARLTGLLYNTSNLIASYVRAGGSRTAITLATLSAANSAYSSGGFKEVDGTNMKGIYRLDIPDAAIAASVPWVIIQLQGAANMVPVSLVVWIKAVNFQDAVRGGMTALPNANAEAAGGLYTRGTGAGQINQPANGIIDGNVVRNAGTAITSAAGRQEVNVTHLLGTAWLTPAVAGTPDVNTKTIGSTAVQSIWDALSSALTTVGSIGKRIVDNLTGDSYGRLGAPSGASVSADLATIAGYIDTEVGAIYNRIGAPAGASVSADVAAIKANLPPQVKKNTAFANFHFVMRDSTTHLPTAGLTVSAERCIGNGSFAACANSVTGVANGLYRIDLNASDLNGDMITFRFTATGADPLMFSIPTNS